MALEIENGFTCVDRFFETIRSTNDLMEFMVMGNYLHKYMKIFIYLLLKDEDIKLQKYVKRLYDKFGKESR
jgi:hypothetical protein